MMKRYIKMPLKKALPLLFIGSLALVATTGCLTSTTTQNSSGGGSGNAGVAVTIISQQTASQVGSGYLVSTPQPGNQFVIFDVAVKNLNQNSLTLGDPYFFKLTTADGTVYEITSLSFLGNNALSVVTNTNPGDKVTGQIAFEIPQSATAKTLTYNDGTNQVITTLSPITASAAAPTATPSVAQPTYTPTPVPTPIPTPTPTPTPTPSPAPVTISFNGANEISHGAVFELSAIVMQGNTPVTTGTVTFSLAGQTYTATQTDSSGIAGRWTSPQFSPITQVGPYTATASYTGPAGTASTTLQMTVT
jgi:hypothetical protein